MTMVTIRRWHFYIGMFIAPSVLFPTKIYDAIKLEPEYLDLLFGNIVRRYGSIDKFLEVRLGVGPREIASLRSKYTVPAP